MDEDIQNSTDGQNPPTTYPAPAQFDANMIAAAQPVEPLTTRRTRRASRRQLLRGRWGLLAGLLVGGLLSAAIAGMLLGFRGAAEPTTVETQSAPPAVNQPVEEAPRLSAPVHQPAKTGDTVPRKIQPAAPATVELRLSNKAGADQKPIARKVGEIVYGRGDRVRGDRKEKKERQQRRRKGDNDDDH